MEHLRDGIGLRGYGQRDPKQEYKKEGFNIFVQMIARVSSNVMTKLMSVEVQRADEADERELAELRRLAARAQAALPEHAEPLPPGAHDEDGEEGPELSGMECPCGSGKAFEKCHGAEDGEESA
jgi:preprotein translocase subunit SecA